MGGKGRRTQEVDEAVGEGLSLQCPDLMPHVLVEVGASCHKCLGPVLQHCEGSLKAVCCGSPRTKAISSARAKGGDQGGWGCKPFTARASDLQASCYPCFALLTAHIRMYFCADTISSD